MPKYLDYHGLETLTSDIASTYVAKSQKGVANGVADLDSNGKVPISRLPEVDGIPSGGTAGQVLAKATNTDYDVEWVNQSGGGGSGGTTNYNDLSNKPKINGITISGEKSLSDLGIAAESAIPDEALELLRTEVIPNTIQSISFNQQTGDVSQIVHSRNNIAVRTDSFTFGSSSITEVRTLSSGASLTIETNLTTLGTTITYLAS